MQSLHVIPKQLDTIVDHCREGFPNEACGMIIGQGNKVIQILPITNVSPTPKTQYQFDPSEQLQALQKIERANLQWIGVFHSHPTGDPIPSQHDISNASLNTPNLAHVIVSLKKGHVQIQAWHLHHMTANPVDLVIGQQMNQSIVPMTATQVWAVIVSIIIGIVLLLSISYILLPPAPPIPTP